MASISITNGKSGTLRTIQFVGADKKRRSIRLGTLPAKDVENIKDKISLLESCRKYGQQPDVDLVAWLGRLDESIYDTLAAGGLVSIRAEKQKGLSLGAFLENFIGQRQALVAAGKLVADTLRKEKQTQHCLVDKFGADRLLKSFTVADAEDFRHYLLTSGSHTVKRCGPEIVVFARRPLAEATVRKHCSIASKFFLAAVRRELVNRNPFDTASVPKANVATNRHSFVTAEDARAVMDKLPDTQWKLLFALCRWGGLRIGETRLVTWGDVLWDEQMILVHSPKTARYEGHETRLVPLFSELAELLDKRYGEAAEGEQHVLPFLQGRTDASLRKVLQRGITSAGVAPWPRLWHNLRLTRQNELLEAGNAQKDVCAAMGNSAAVASRHYEKSNRASLLRMIAPLNAPPIEKTAVSR